MRMTTASPGSTLSHNVGTFVHSFVRTLVHRIVIICIFVQFVFGIYFESANTQLHFSKNVSVYLLEIGTSAKRNQLQNGDNLQQAKQVGKSPGSVGGNKRKQQIFNLHFCFLWSFSYKLFFPIFRILSANTYKSKLSYTHRHIHTDKT